MSLLEHSRCLPAYAAAVVLLVCAPASQAAVIFNITQVGANVVVTGSGALPVGGLVGGTTVSFVSSAQAASDSGFMALGVSNPANTTYRVRFAANYPYGAGFYVFANAEAGDDFGVFNGPATIVTPVGYPPNAALSPVTTSVSEPASVTLVFAGLAALGWMTTKRRRSRSSGSRAVQAAPLVP